MQNSRFTQTRRQFLHQAALGTAAGLSLGLSACSTKKASHTPKIPVGLQLYSLRAECKNDFPGTLAAVKKIGYPGVEFAGYWGRSAPELRKMLDDNGLLACGTHAPFESLKPDKIEETIEFNQTIGNRFIICPSMTARSHEEWVQRAQMFDGLADKLKPLGLWVGYHTHAHDFQPLAGERPLDIFFGNTKPEVILQLDTSNCCDGGADPVAVLNQYPGRVRTIHIKPNGGGPEAVIGEDKINWQAVFAFCETKGNTRWYVVEHETSKNPLQTVERTFHVLKHLGKV